MESTDFRVRTYGKFAMVTALTTSKSKYLGQALTNRERVTDIFVMENGRWKCVLTQLSYSTEK
jgi:ketosteroid isomerase-like protein